MVRVPAAYGESYPGGEKAVLDDDTDAPSTAEPPAKPPPKKHLRVCTDQAVEEEAMVMPYREEDVLKPIKKEAVHHQVFVDAETMKARLRESMLKPKYEVSNFYKTKGFCQLVARHQKFEYTTLAVIALNALWIAIDTDNNKASVFLEAKPIFQIVDHFFCMYFSFELTIRFGAFKFKRNCIRDPWFVFDTFMVVLMVGETWVMTSVMLAVGGVSAAGLGNASILRLLRLLRLSRMARMAKLLRSMPELLILIKGMVSAMRSVFFTLLLLGILIYVFGVAFRQLTKGLDVEASYFPTIWVAMHTLLLNATILDGLGDLIAALQQEGIGFVIVLWVFTFLSAFTVLNMLIGVLCEVVSNVASTEREQITVGMVKDGFMELVDQEGIDQDNNMKISRREFEALMENPACLRLLQKVQVDPYGLIDLADFIFEPDQNEDDDEEEQVEKDLSFEEFMEVILSLRGSNQAVVKDIVDLRHSIKVYMTSLEEKLKRRGFVHRTGGTVNKQLGLTPPLEELSVIPTKSSPRPVRPQRDLPAGPCLKKDAKPASAAEEAKQRHRLWLQGVRLEGVLSAAQGEVERFLAALPSTSRGSSSSHCLDVGPSSGDAGEGGARPPGPADATEAQWQRFVSGRPASGSFVDLVMDRLPPGVPSHVNLEEPPPSRVEGSVEPTDASTRAPSEAGDLAELCERMNVLKHVLAAGLRDLERAGRSAAQRCRC